MSSTAPPMASFFKIILPDFLQTLRLPPKFVKKFGAQLSDVARLKIRKHNNQEWPVTLRKTNGEVYLENGWHEFVEHFSISTGHLLVFSYEGPSQLFYVAIFDMSACEIDYGTGIGQGAEGLNTTCQPSFSLTLKSSSLQYMPIPGKFGRTYLGEGIKTATLVLGARRWDIGVFKAGNYYYKLIKGWRVFYKEMKLRAGDVFECELVEVKEGNVVLKVHIKKRD